ncbi:MAG: hypothetical protein AAFY02_13875 [Pseudomonadota bacterium]
MTITRTQPSFAAGELTPALQARSDLAKYHVGLRFAENLFVRPQGGIVNRPGTRFVCEVADSEAASRLLPFSFSTLQTYVLEFADKRMRVLLNGGLALESAEPLADISQAEAVSVFHPGHSFGDGEEVVITGGQGMEQIKERVLLICQAEADRYCLRSKSSVLPLDSRAFHPYHGGAKVSRVYSLATPYAVADLQDLSAIQSADVLYLVHPDYPLHKLSRTDHTAWTLEAVTFAPDIAAPGGVGVSATYDTAGTDTTYRYQVTAIAADSGEESLASSAASAVNDLSLAGNKNSITWSAVAGADRYEVYKDDNGVFGFIGGTEGLSFEDANITADLSSTPPKAKNPFEGTGNRPSTATFFEQRLVLAATNKRPQTLWFSTTANFENFGTRSIAQADDSVEVTLVARQVNAVRHLVAKEDLWALTSGGEWRIRGGGDVDYITPSSVTTKKISAWGASKVPPLEIGSSILFVVEKGQAVRDLFHQITVDTFATQEGSDLSVLSSHLFEGRTIKAWAYAQTPHSLIWVVMDDGSLLSFTYFREHQVYAWTRHATERLSAEDGCFEDVTVISEDGEDVPYFLVSRQVQGRRQRSIERMPQRVTRPLEEAFFLDCGLSYAGPATQGILGLDHLEGRQVTVLADGQVLRDLTVTAGALALPFAAGKVQVGLAYEATLRSLPLPLETRAGPTTGRMKRPVRLTVTTYETRGLWAGPSADRLFTYRPRSSEALGSPLALTEGRIELDLAAEWSREADLWIKQRDPLPMEILAITPEVSLGR